MSHNTTICTHDAGEMAPTFVKNKLQLSILVVYLKFKGFFFHLKEKKNIYKWKLPLSPQWYLWS